MGGYMLANLGDINPDDNQHLDNNVYITFGNTAASPYYQLGYVSADGALELLKGATKVMVFDSYCHVGSGVTSHALASLNDFYITGQLEVDGAVFLDSTCVVAGNLTATSRILGASAAITAANNLTLGTANQNIVGGATQINAIITTGWTAGSTVTLVFSSTPTVKHNTAGGAGTAVLLLAGSADFVAAANSTLTLQYDGTSWQEIARKGI